MNSLRLVILNLALVFFQPQPKTFIPDLTVNNKIRLIDAKSVVDNLGDLRHKIIEDSKATRVCFKNSNSSQYLIIYHLDGANANSFNEFEIGTLINKNSKYIKLKNFELVTESNIKLGITLQDLLSSNGKPKSVTNREGLKIVRYVIKDVNNALLKKVNMPEYRAEYFFKKGILVKFVYGFPNL